jgi:DNA (cytosine-5)-methyltransferase 1
LSAYYNEIDPFAAQWLRNLIAENLIAPGDVDERSILDVAPRDLAGYDQCHFFAGVGGWSYALRLAAWPDHRPVWTGSCPCQPFSAAGKGGGFADERHLWPYWRWLIGQCRPDTILGEQVASRAGLDWFDLVRSDLEGSSYSVGVSDLCAAGVGAPHIRQRLWFVADAVQPASERRAGSVSGTQAPLDSARGLNGRVADGFADGGEVGELAHATSEQMGLPGQSRPWSDPDWLPCTDGKARLVEPGTFPLAHGIPGRVGRLRAYGNAIVPQVAEQFIRAVM